MSHIARITDQSMEAYQANNSKLLKAIKRELIHKAYSANKRHNAFFHELASRTTISEVSAY